MHILQGNNCHCVNLDTEAEQLASSKASIPTCKQMVDNLPLLSDVTTTRAFKVTGKGVLCLTLPSEVLNLGSVLPFTLLLPFR